MAMIAIRPTEDKVKDLAKINVIGTKLNSDEYHITLFYFEKLNMEDCLKTIETCYAVGKKSGTIYIESKEVVSFPEGEDGFPVILKINSDELVQFRKKLAKKLDEEKLNYSKKWPIYSPHLTLSYSHKEFTKTLSKKIDWYASEIVIYAGEDMKDGICCTIPLQLNKKNSACDWEMVKAEVFESLTKIAHIL